jgi:uncharacterized membrane protein (UPF0127 family)
MYKIIFKSSIQLTAITLLLTLSGCNQATTTSIVTPNGGIIAVEIAVTPQQQEQGLMFRKSLAENSGMLFIFDQERMMSFWMKNTLIPLDVIFLDQQGTVVDIQTMPPCLSEQAECPSYPAKGKAKYALEINAGKAEKLGLKNGDLLKLNIPSNVQTQTM